MTVVQKELTIQISGQEVWIFGDYGKHSTGRGKGAIVAKLCLNDRVVNSGRFLDVRNLDGEESTIFRNYQKWFVTFTVISVERRRDSRSLNWVWKKFVVNRHAVVQQ
jgi:hypothetical protein